MAGQSIMDRRIFGSKAVSLAIQACKGAVSVASQSSLRLCEDCGAPANQVLDRLPIGLSPNWQQAAPLTSELVSFSRRPYRPWNEI